jgi:serine/threonine-protein kinase
MTPAPAGPTVTLPPAGSAEATGPYLPTAPADQSVEVALTPGGGRPPPVEDVGTLLRKRLLFFALLMTGTLVAGLLMLVGTGLPADGWGYFAIAVLGLGPVAGGVLWARRSLSLRQIRAVELVLFGAMYAQWSLVHAFLYPKLELPRPPLWFGFILGYAVSLPWAFLIIVYGIFIPNTWRRCAAVVGVMAVTPLVISVANGLAAKATAGHSPANYLFAVGLFMAVAVTIAVYGSHRIEVLRREVVAAHKLGPYVLKRKLGEGGMGEVWLAEHRLLKRPCAVKFVRAELAANPATAARFEREVRAVTGLTHFNTVRVYDYGRADDGSFYYVMEYLDGPTLEALVGRFGPLDPGRAVYLMRQVCGALAEAHAAGLVHRDLKPSNIIVATLGGQHDVAKLLDFGLVQDLATVSDPDRLTRTGTVLGTPAYMSPEQAGGEAVDARGDVYSLGAVAFFALGGRPPFEGATVGQLLSAHLTKPVPDVAEVRPGVPADLAAVVARCLAKDPAHRFQTAVELDEALARCGCAGDWSAAAAEKWWATRSAAGEPDHAAPTRAQ